MNGGQITEHAAIWTNGERTDLGTLPGDTQSAAFAINNTGVVVGISNANYSVQNGNGWNPQAVVWVNDVISALPNLPNATGSEALAVNSSGHIVGFCYTEEYLYNTFSFAESPLACIWENGKVIDLNSLLPENSGWALQEATGINDNDQIIGTGTYDGAFSAFVLNLGATGAVITNTTGQQTTLTAPAPNTPIQGGGYDVLSLSQNAIASASSAYSITANADGSFTLATTGSSDHVSGVIQIQFADKTLTIATANSFNEYVALLYQGALGRTPDAGGLAGWEQLANALPTSELATGVYALSNFSGNYNTTLSIAAGFTNSAEFEAKYGSLSNLQFVTQLYSNILDRAPDSGGAD